MSRPIEYKLFGSSQRAEVITAIKVLPPTWTVVAYPPSNSDKQKRTFYRLLGMIVKKKLKFFGREWDKHAWHDIMLSGHAAYTRGERDDHAPSLIEGIEGEPIQMRESVASMSKERMSSLIAYTETWMANRPEFMEEAHGPAET